MGLVKLRQSFGLITSGAGDRSLLTYSGKASRPTFRDSKKVRTHRGGVQTPPRAANFTEKEEK